MKNDKLYIKTKDVEVDNGENGFWYKSWYEVRYGLYNKNGEEIVPPVFTDISESEDMFIGIYARKGQKEIYFINNKGKIVETNLNIIDAKDFKHGYSIIQVADLSTYNRSVPWTYVVNECKWGLIDKEGNVICKPTFDYEHEVEISDLDLINNKIKENGFSVLNYVSSKVFLKLDNIKEFKNALKTYLVNYYKQTKDKDLLKEEIEKQNKMLKEIAQAKLRNYVHQVKLKVDENIENDDFNKNL